MTTNKIEIRRMYNIKTAEGLELQIERDVPLNEELTERILEEDNISIFKDSRIVVVTKKRQYLKRKAKKKAKKAKKARKKTTIKSEGPEALAEKAILPADRINKMLEIEGNFTRQDYQKVINESGHMISNSNGHIDIRDALYLGKIEQIGGKGKELRVYRVIDITPINRESLRKIRVMRKV